MGIGGTHLAFELDFLFILVHVKIWAPTTQGRAGRLTLYGAYHFARRVLPLVEVSPHEIAMEALDVVCWTVQRTAGSGSE